MTSMSKSLRRWRFLAALGLLSVALGLAPPG
jgi:hypothetical protein